jgi:hypothetical protein
MSTKNIIISLVGVIVIGTAVYFSITKEHLSIEATTLPPTQTTKIENLTQKDDSVKEPTSTSSTDDIINYLVNVQPHIETQSAQKILDVSATSSADTPIIRTNF